MRFRFDTLTKITVIAVLLGTLPSCKKLIRKVTGKLDDGNSDTVESTEKAKGGSGCDLPSGTLAADHTVTSGCEVTVERDIAIDKDAILRIDPGARLLFKSGAGIVVRHGGIVAKGTEKEPVVFTSANKSPAKGDWDGIRFEGDVSAGTVFDHVVIEYAGKSGGYNKGAMTFWGESPAERVTVTNSVFRNNDQRAVENRRAKSRFAKFEGNELTNNDGTSMLLHPNVVGSIGTNKLGEPIRIVGGQVNETATWPKTEQPLFVEGELSVQGIGSAAILTLPEGATLKFGANVRMDIGEGAGGGLVAKNVTFTSADPTPAPGAWVGLLIFPKATSTKIEGSTIEYAGKKAGYGRGAMTFWGTKPADLASFEVKNTVFRKNKEAAFFARGGCGELDQPSSGNRSEDATLCDTK